MSDNRYHPNVFMRIMRTLTMVVCCSIFVVAAYTLPAQAQSFPTLQDSKNPALQKALLEGLEKLSLTKAVANNRLAVTVVDITDLTKPQMAEVNGAMMMLSLIHI